MIKRSRLICGIITAIILLITLNSAEAGYNSTIRKWTKGDRIYTFDTMDAKLMWKATFLTDEVLDAQDALLAKKNMNEKVVRPEGEAFFVSLYTKEDLKEFSLYSDSVWKAYLVDANGVEVPAESVQVVSITPTERVFYPYLDRWNKAYMVKFPAVELGEKPQLVLRSIVAESKLKWKIK